VNRRTLLSAAAVMRAIRPDDIAAPDSAQTRTGLLHCDVMNPEAVR
jgi:hypothetical protein